MLTPIEIGKKLTERFDIRSGTIVAQNPLEETVEYGVIFSTSEPHSGDDFDPARILGALVESVELRGKEEDRFTRILGGYYFKRNFNGETKSLISNLFGVALKGGSGFDYLEEGGSAIINDQWKRKFKVPSNINIPDGDENLLNELTLGAEGWTFIVEAKDDDSKYPQSGKEMALWTECPAITGLSIEIGDCEKEGAIQILKRSVVFQIETDEVVPASWKLEFGDGTSTDGIGKPPQTLRHLYANKPTEPPLLTVFATNINCRENENRSSAIPLTAFDEFTVCPACPKVTKVSVISVSYPDDHTAFVNVKAEIEGATPTSYLWDWGDGEIIKTSTASTSHIYQRPQKVAIVYPISLKIEGPEDCQDEGKTNAEINPIPVLPLLCRLFLHIVPFLISLILGATLVCYIAEYVEGNEEAVVQLEGFIGIVFAIMTICLLMWYRKCPLTTGDWLNIGWPSMLSAFLVSCYLLNCYPMTGAIIVFLLLSAVLFYMSERLGNLLSKPKTYLGLLVVTLFATIVSCFILANGYLACV